MKMIWFSLSWWVLFRFHWASGFFTVSKKFRLFGYYQKTTRRVSRMMLGFWNVPNLSHELVLINKRINVYSYNNSDNQRDISEAAGVRSLAVKNNVSNIELFLAWCKLL